jgi:hypothetical protein
LLDADKVCCIWIKVTADAVERQLLQCRQNAELLQ